MRAQMNERRFMLLTVDARLRGTSSVELMLLLHWSVINATLGRHEFEACPSFELTHGQSCREQHFIA